MVNISFNSISYHLHKKTVFYPMYYDAHDKNEESVMQIKRMVGVDEGERS